MNIIEVRKNRINNTSIIVKVLNSDGSIQELIKQRTDNSIYIDMPSNTSKLSKPFIVELTETVSFDKIPLMLLPKETAEKLSHRKTIQSLQSSKKKPTEEERINDNISDLIQIAEADDISLDITKPAENLPEICQRSLLYDDFGF